MSKDILLVVEAMSNEKGVDREIIFSATEAALEIATKEHLGADIDVKVQIDRKTGEYTTYRRWLVVEDVVEGASEDEGEGGSDPATQESNSYPNPQQSVWQRTSSQSGDESSDVSEEEARATMPLSQAKHYNPQAIVGDYIQHEIESVAFSRIATQKAKQIILKKVLEAERTQLVNAYREKLGQLITGVAKRVTRDLLTIDLGNNTEAILYRADMLPHDAFRAGDRVRALLYQAVAEGSKPPQILLSRTCPEMLVELFKLEVPEIGADIINIKAVARDPGYRAKIAVKTNDGRIDPIGACVGMRGTRVQAVSGELGGERIDIVLWDDNPAQLVINAMSPAEVVSILVDEEIHTMDLGVKTDQLAQAIGRHGQNVRLVSELTTWTINVMTDEEAKAKSAAESEKIVLLFQEKLQVDANVASKLAEEGFSSLEEIAYVPIDELLAIPDFDRAMVATLREQAEAVLLTQAIAKEQVLAKEPADDLLHMEGMNRELAYRLASCNIMTRENLAEQSVDDLLEIQHLDREVAKALIMTARKMWFEDASDDAATTRS